MNYALDTPTKRNVYVPENDIPFAPAFQPSNSSEVDQTHRRLTWLHHKPPLVAPTELKPEAGRDKKK
jgi:hypothetical protein